MKTEETRERSESLKGLRAESTCNAEPKPSSRDKFERDRPSQDELILHDDDEAELDLPR